MATLTSSIYFLEPWSSPTAPTTESPYTRQISSPGYPPTNFKNHKHSIKINDARHQKSLFNLDTHGFTFTDCDSLDPDVLRAIRAQQKKYVKENYLPTIEELVKRLTGATRVQCFNYTYRKRNPEVDMAKAATINQPVRKKAYAVGQPATTVHCDQSPWSAERRVRQHTGKDADRLLKGRCQILNIWRPLSNPVTDWPLAVMDSQTLAPEHIHPTSLYKDREEPYGQFVGINYSEDQKWYFLEKQRPDEVTVMKMWDNREDVARLCAHSAFEHPHPEPGGVPRESIEVRCLVFYDTIEASG